MTTYNLNTNDIIEHIHGTGFRDQLNAAYTVLKNDPVLNDGKTWEDYESLSLSDLRHYLLKKGRRFYTLRKQFKYNIKALYYAKFYLDGMIGFNYGLSNSMVAGTIRNSTTDPELLRISDQIENYEVVAAYSLTELGHGSNTKGMQTTAHYDPKTQEFLMNTPTFEATKCWSGNLGHSAMYALVYSQLYTPDGECHGLHGFVVQVRNKELLPMPGITVGDMGHKIGLNSVANGYLLMNNIRIPRTNLLNRFGDITPDGTYVFPLKNKTQQFSALLAPLSAGRIAIATSSTMEMILAITIGVRYSFARKQFGPVEGGKECPVISYQLQQWRLLPYVACSYVWNFSTAWLNNQLEIMLKNKDEQGLIGVGKELHALSCSAKAVSGWLTQGCIQEVREACGGHGYLSVNRIGTLRNSNDPRNTYEGDNNCILMQTSMYLLSLYKKIKQGQFVSGPLGSVDYLNGMQHLQKRCKIKTIADINPNTITEAYMWLVTYLLKRSSEKFVEQYKQTKDPFFAKNNSQVYFCRTLAIAFIENFVLQKFLNEKLYTAPLNLHPIFRIIYLLNGLWLLERHMATLFEGGYLTSGDQGRIIREAILKYCSELKPNALVLINAIAPPDWVLNSPIGLSNLDPHKNLYDAMVTEKSQERPSWWKELLQPVDQGSKSHLISSKL